MPFYTSLENLFSIRYAICILYIIYMIYIYINSAFHRLSSNIQLLVKCAFAHSMGLFSKLHYILQDCKLCFAERITALTWQMQEAITVMEVSCYIISWIHILSWLEQFPSYDKAFSYGYTFWTGEMWIATVELSSCSIRTTRNSLLPPAVLRTLFVC